jgi:hypothetical protein
MNPQHVREYRAERQCRRAAIRFKASKYFARPRHCYPRERPCSWFGWPTDPKMEALPDVWFDALDSPAQLRICRQMQKQFFLAEPILCACDYLRVVTLNSGTGLGKSIRRRLLHEIIENSSSADGNH